MVGSVKPGKSVQVTADASKNDAVVVDEAWIDLLSRGKCYTTDKHGTVEFRILIHRLITGAKRGEEVDHANGDKWDNRKANLRICTRSQNLMNTTRRLGKTPYRGVNKEAKAKHWQRKIIRKQFDYII